MSSSWISRRSSGRVRRADTVPAGSGLLEMLRASGVAWDAHTTAERLIRARRIPPLILVGVHSTADRLNEYTPCADSNEGAGGRGALNG